jgi:hypothetical protein
MAKDSEAIRQTLANVYGDLLEFWTAARHVFVDKTGKPKGFISMRTLLNVQWQRFEDTFGEIERRFEHHLNVLKLQLDTSVWKSEHARLCMHHY